MFILQMEEKWDFDVKNKKSAPKKGRRAGFGFFSLNIKENNISNESGKEIDNSNHKERKLESWADEITKSNSTKRVNISEIDQAGNGVDLDDGIPVIPNLEDNSDEDFIHKIAKAPLIDVNRVATYKELETDLLKHIAFANLEEVNLRILTDHLYPESALAEPDEPWTQENLLSEIISAMNDEREKQLGDR